MFNPNSRYLKKFNNIQNRYTQKELYIFSNS